MIGVIAGRELRSLFASPMAWAMLAVVQGLLGYMFLTYVDEYLMNQGRLAAIEGAPGVTRLVVSQWLNAVAIILMLVVPLLTMRLISGEWQSQTMALLLSSPLSATQIVLGKYLGALGFLAVMLLLLLLLPSSLLMGGDLDYGLLTAAFIGLALLLSSFAAVGLYMSTLTRQPTIAAISAVGVLLFLWLIDWARVTDGEAINNVLSQLSLARHFQPLTRGVFASSDVIYFLLFISLFLVLSVRRLGACKK